MHCSWCVLDCGEAHLSKGITYFFRHGGLSGKGPISWLSSCNQDLQTIDQSRDSQEQLALMNEFEGFTKDNREMFASPGMDTFLAITMVSDTESTIINELDLAVTFSYAP